MKKFIHILLSKVIALNYKIQKMDVMIAFLNDKLDECIYMVQPEGFLEKGLEWKVYLLQRSIYGLKQASRS